MYSIAFPEMFKSTGTILTKDSHATLSNTSLLLQSWQGALLGDPGFGTNLKRYIYSQNNIILKDIIIDDIYAAILQFIPQLYVKREDIKLTQIKTGIHCTINCINKQDNQSSLYEIDLITDDLTGGN